MAFIAIGFFTIGVTIGSILALLVAATGMAKKTEEIEKERKKNIQTLKEKTMYKLIEKDDQGNWCLKGVKWEQLRTGQVITKEVGEKLYGALCKLMDYEDTGCSPDDVERLNDFTQSEAAKLLQKLNAEEKKHEWIPVEEKLPEPEKLVLLSFETSSVLAVGRYIVDVDDNGTFRVGDDEDFIELDLHVNAWMPLPEPYREKEEEKPDANITWRGYYMDRFEKVE